MWWWPSSECKFFFIWKNWKRAQNFEKTKPHATKPSTSSTQFPLISFMIVFVLYFFFLFDVHKTVIEKKNNKKFHPRLLRVCVLRKNPNKHVCALQSRLCANETWSISNNLYSRELSLLRKETLRYALIIALSFQVDSYWSGGS